MRAGKMAELDKRRTELLHHAAVKIQCNVRGWLARSHFQRVVQAVLTLQAATRGMLARTVARNLRREKAATLIQANLRRYWVSNTAFLQLGHMSPPCCHSLMAGQLS